MERLTLNHAGGICAFVSTEECHEQPNCDYCIRWRSILKRLAAYEDTGLEPKQVAELEAKAEALPVMRERSLIGDYRCPTCNVAFHARWVQPSGISTKPKELVGATPYCRNCGQRLGWS